MILKKGVLFIMCVFFVEKWENGDIFFISQVTCVDKTLFRYPHPACFILTLVLLEHISSSM